jgi:hypothetical protein
VGAAVEGPAAEDAYETVLRDALAVDTLDPAGVYFGTRSGKLYGSSDGGSSWTQMAEGLPPIVCVKTAVVGSPDAKRSPPQKAAPRRQGEAQSRTAKTATKRARGSKKR